MNFSKEYIQANRAAFFDWVVLLVSFMMGFIYPSLSDFTTSPGFHNWMLAALLLYFAGVLVKHRPLSYRLTYSVKSTKPVPYFIFLFVGHWFIFLFLVILAEPAIRDILQLPALTAENTASWQIITGALVTATVLTWLVYRNKTYGKKEKELSERSLFRIEIIADILLIAGVSILSFVFWEKGVMAMLSRATMQSMSEIGFLFVFLSILFLFFYLPLRYLFFIEDRERGRNRRRLLLIFAFILVRAILEMLGA